MGKIDFLEIIGKLNDEIYTECENAPTFSYQTNSFVDVILFGDHPLWDSENDERIWIEAKKDYEPFEPFIRREFNKYVDELTALRFKRVPKAPVEEDEL